MLAHTASYWAFWAWLAHQFTLLGLYPHGCELAVLGNAHGPHRWLWLQWWSGRTRPCWPLNHCASVVTRHGQVFANRCSR